MENKEPILGFKDEYRFLSNFWAAPVTYEGIIYPTAEHAYQASKTNCYQEKVIIAKCDTPGQAKRAGQKLTLRSDWEDIRCDIMEEIVYAKFSQNKDLGKLLLDTYPRDIIELNTWGDQFWGVTKQEDGVLVGDNALGIILYNVRHKLLQDLRKETIAAGIRFLRSLQENRTLANHEPIVQGLQTAIELILEQEELIEKKDKRGLELFEALEFYANYETYWAINYLPDPPCGALMEDFHIHPEDPHERPRPGKTAYLALYLPSEEYKKLNEEIEND